MEFIILQKFGASYFSIKTGYNYDKIGTIFSVN